MRREEEGGIGGMERMKDWRVRTCGTGVGISGMEGVGWGVSRTNWR